MIDILTALGESPDEWINKEEQSRFEDTINELLMLGEISEEEAKTLLDIV
jgi:polyhydroxyalkanoate synthesis regulator phasin